MSRSPSLTNCLDPLDLIDFPEYEQMSYHSPSISPSAGSKPMLVLPVASTPTATNSILPSSQQSLQGPSHNYELYKQQTGIPTGALHSTLAMNPANSFDSYNGYLSSGVEDFIDFGSVSSIDVDLESSPTESALLCAKHTASSSSEYVNPSVIGSQDNSSSASSLGSSTHRGNVGRLWPGMHTQQAALEKAQQQRKQQQQLIQLQRQQSLAAQHPMPQRSKAQQPTDPIVEEKISQLLHTMRQGTVSTALDDDRSTPQVLTQHPRSRKDEEDMDEDEKLLASEEGKKLSSKERRQLRNKVSARAFRSRRKEYIGQLEGEIAAKVNENSDLRSQNRALMEENARLTDLTRMLLSSPSFSGFLDSLTPNITAQPTPATVAVDRLAESRQLPKDVNPYAAQQHMQDQQVNLTPSPNFNGLSMIDINGDGGYGYQPQVFSVLSLPEATIDTSVLSGKTSNFVEASFESDDEKVEMPVIERLPPMVEETVVSEPSFIDEDFDSDPAFALYTQAPAPASSPQIHTDLDLAPLFGGIESEKVFPRYELVTQASDDTISAVDMARVERLFSSLDAVAARLEAMTIGV